MLYSKPLPFVSAAMLLLLALSFHLPSALAANGTGQATEIEALKQQLNDLQLRVERLEKDRGNSLSFSTEPDVEPVPGGWRKLHNWNLLKEGMTAYQVKTILGEPERQKTVSKFEFLYYGDGKVTVYLRRVKGWEIPVGIGNE